MLVQVAFLVFLTDIGSDQRDRLQGEQAQRCRQHPRQHLRFKGPLRQGAPGSTCSASPRSHRWKLREGGETASMPALDTSHFLVTTAQEFGDSQDSLWRSAVTSLRGYAQGYDGLQANRSACAVSEFGEWAAYQLNFCARLLNTI
jgi:hypothetical protein